MHPPASFTRGTTYWALIYIEGANDVAFGVFVLPLFCLLSHSNSEIDFFYLYTLNLVLNMKPLHSWAKIKKTNASLCWMHQLMMFLFLLVVAVWVCFFVDEADPTLPPPSHWSRFGQKHVPVRCRRPWRWVKNGKDGDFFPTKNC